MEPVALDHLPRSDLGEGPWWDAASSCLYWVDISGHRVHRFEPRSGRCETHEIGTFVSFAIVDAGGALVLGLQDGIYRTTFGNADRTLLWRADMPAENRFNDGLCDPRGRLWAGTMHVDASRDRVPTGALYRADATGLHVVASDVGIANGLGWSPDGRTMYFAETFAGIVWAYDYDVDAGLVGPRRIFTKIDAADGTPDGLTVDSQGQVYVAIWRSSRINIFEASGALADAIILPVSCPTSCCFGGDDLKTLYITTARRGPDGDPSDAPPTAGCLFAWSSDVPGVAEARMA